MHIHPYNIQLTVQYFVHMHDSSWQQQINYTLKLHLCQLLTEDMHKQIERCSIYVLRQHQNQYAMA